MKARDYKDATDLAVQCITGDVTHTLKAEGFDASVHGTGRGQPIVTALSVALRGREGGATAELGDDTAGCLRASSGGGDKPHVLIVHGTQDPIIGHDQAHTLGRNSGQENAVLIVLPEGERDGELVNGARQGSNDLSAGAMRSMCGAGGRSASQEPGLARPLAGEPAKALSELPHQGAQVGGEMHALRQSAQGTGVLRHALPALQEMGRPDHGEGQPVHGCAQGFGDEPGVELQGDRVRQKASCSGLLPEARAAVSQGDTGVVQRNQSGSYGQGLGYQTHAVRRLTPTECERLQGFPDGHTLVPHRKKPAADGPRYKALGNSMAVPVMRWIGRRIEAHLPANDNRPEVVR